MERQALDTRRVNLPYRRTIRKLENIRARHVKLGRRVIRETRQEPRASQQHRRRSYAEPQRTLHPAMRASLYLSPVIILQYAEHARCHTILRVSLL